MRKRLTKSYPRYCDTGPNEGMYVIEISGNIYITTDEYKKYAQAGNDLTITIGSSADGQSS